jgi:hypothetical protein
MGIRPHSTFVKQTRARRCPKCGCAINNQRTRCKKCSSLVGKPIKSRRKKVKFRQSAKCR